ncbi:TPA: hypothetical protein KD856_003979 [Vibrio parahaemolyticus]|nr:hypothetical protein [Vibrio parahaemolyticus]
MQKNDLLSQLKELAAGSNPLTKTPLPETSIMKKYDSIQFIVTLIQELEVTQHKPTKSLEEQSIKNRMEGKPDRHRFSWTESEKIELRDAFLQDLSPKTIAKAHQRTISAVVSQLLAMELIDKDEADSYL